jgi:putative spermidine/putrescine transport system ATP-binding protein
MQRQALTITLRGLRKAYGPVRALDDVNLEVRSGEFLTLLGPSGSGKTTLLMVLAGFIRPDQGQLLFGDQDVTRLAPHKRDIGMVFQNYALFPHMDVAGNIAYPLQLRGMARDEQARRVQSALQTVQLAGFGTRRIDELSGGQRQRVWIAMALAQQTGILLLDEPTTYLDLAHQIDVLDLLVDLNRADRRTIVLVLHDLNQACRYSHHLVAMRDGAVVVEGAPSDVVDETLVRDVFDLDAKVVPDPVSGTPMVVPIGRHRTGDR